MVIPLSHTSRVKYKCLAKINENSKNGKGTILLKSGKNKKLNSMYK